MKLFQSTFSCNPRSPLKKSIEIIDGMAFVHVINETREIKTCKDFCNAFNNLSMQERVVFESYFNGKSKLYCWKTISE